MIEDNNDQPINKNSNNNRAAKIILQNFTEDIITNIKDENENNRCIICLEDYKINDIIIYLPCIHFFHKKCIAKWIEKTINCPICPLCKNEL